MKKMIRSSFALAILSVCFLLFGMTAYANENTINAGVYAGKVELSGKTAAEATSAVNAFVDGLKDVEVILIAGADTEVPVKAGDLGIRWANPEIVEDALNLGTQGNVVQRYKALKDLQKENKVYPVELAFDVQAINDVLIDKCSKYDAKPSNATMTRVDGQFQITEGTTGYMLDVESSIDIVYDFLAGDWDYAPCRIALETAVVEPKGTAEELMQLTDILGTFTTKFKTSGKSRSANVTNGCSHINGTLLYPGEEFSTYKTVAPFSEANGYYMAGSYLNGKVVDSLGGGICQVSTTLYNAVLKAELEVTERNNHSMIVNYVDPSADAAIAESAGKDFRFRNNLDYPIYIEGITTSDKTITFNIYGRETRDTEHRKVRYESEIIERIDPPADSIYPDGGHAIGYIVTDSAHIGYKAKLWKIVTEDGVEVSREQVNSSNYKMSPRSATVGVQTADPQAYEEIMAAIGTGSIDHVKNVIAAITSREAANSVEIGDQ